MEAGATPYCEQDDGLLPDGTCSYGYPDLLDENIFALQFWEQVQLLGWEGAASLNEIALCDYDRASLVTKLSIIAMRIQKAEKAANHG